MKYCPKCDAPNDDSAKICKQCGCMLTPATTTSKTESWETIKKPTFPEHCIRCGEPLEGRYCKNCGADQLAETFVQSNVQSNIKKREINIAMLIVGITFACFFAANFFANIWTLWIYDFEGGFMLWMEVLFYLAATVLSVVAGGYLYSYFSRRQ